jgi:hypothetical protein
VQLFAVALRRGDGAAPDPRGALTAAAGAFPQLDPATLALDRSDSGRLACARISHAPDVAAPRRYAAARDGALVLFDGFPLERHGRFAAHDAAVLAEHWTELPGVLEGIFSAVRVDLRRDRVECLVDAVGLAPVFTYRTRDLVLLANSVEALRHLAGLREPDVLGLASLVALGWPAGGRTLFAGVRFLAGGGPHRLDADGTTSAGLLTPATVLAGARDRPPLPAGQLLATVRAAGATGAPLASALTAGRDTRVLLALTRAARADVAFYTSGPPEDIDVQIARRLAERFALRHSVLLPRPPDSLDAWAAQTTSFVLRGDGLSPIESISDHLDHDGVPVRLGLELWGIAGEVGRTMRLVKASLAALTPLLRSSYEVQRRMAQRSVEDSSGLLGPDALGEVRGWLDDFVAARRAEGWRADAILQVLFTFGRLRHWSARGVRRAAATTDLYSPFACRAYVEHCFGLSAAARCVEQPHRRLIDAYAPEVDAERYEMPWGPRDPRLALPGVLRVGAGRLASRLRGRASGGPPPPPPPLGPRWFEAGLELHREVALSSPSSPLWDVVDRRRYEALLAATPQERAAHADSLGRVLTAQWYLSGPGR